jgi:transcriptional regulator with XRE-family HTH domain
MHKDFMEKFDLIRKRLKYLADLQGLSLIDLARDSGYTYAVLQNTLRGFTPVKADMRIKLASMVGEDVWEQTEMI